MGGIEAGLICARGAHIGGCLLLFSIFAFDCCVLGALPRDSRIESRGLEERLICFFNLVFLPIILLSGIAWLCLVAMNMSGTPFQIGTVKMVWQQTQFGALWQIRLFLWCSAALVAAFFPFAKRQARWQQILLWAQLLLSGASVGSLAFAGHGLEGSRWHLGADVLHLLGAGFWPAGLLPFLIFFRAMLRERGTRFPHPAALLVHRFSAISLGSVALLSATGLVNAWFLVDSWAGFVKQPYGRWLLLKVLFFIFAVAIGAVNLLRLKPRLTGAEIQRQDATAAAARLQANVLLELILGGAIIAIVALLGILPPVLH